jgi:hypothetical protein
MRRNTEKKPGRNVRYRKSTPEARDAVSAKIRDARFVPGAGASSRDDDERRVNGGNASSAALESTAIASPWLSSSSSASKKNVSIARSR